MLEKPMIGGFQDGAGGFYDQEDYQGRELTIPQCCGMLARMTVFTASTTAGISGTLRLA